MTLVLIIHHQQEYLVIYVIYVCITGYFYIIIDIIIIIFMLYFSVFAPPGELRRSVLKVRQSRQLGQEKTATWKCLWTDPRESKHLQCVAHPLAQLFCHHLKQRSLRDSLTKGATWESSGSEILTQSWRLWALFTHLANSCLSQDWKGKVSVTFGVGDLSREMLRLVLAAILLWTWRRVGAQCWCSCRPAHSRLPHGCSVPAVTPIPGVHAIRSSVLLFPA